MKCSESAVNGEQSTGLLSAEPPTSSTQTTKVAQERSQQSTQHPVVESSQQEDEVQFIKDINTNATANLHRPARLLVTPRPAQPSGFKTNAAAKPKKLDNNFYLNTVSTIRCA